MSKTYKQELQKAKKLKSSKKERAQSKSLVDEFLREYEQKNQDPYIHLY